MSLLRQHQHDGAAWLAGRSRGYLADPPGMGKTRALIYGLQLAGVERPLVVCPAIVRSHWSREFETMGWAGQAPMIVSPDQIVRGSTFAPPKLADGLVLDEAHMYKHAGSKRTSLILGSTGLARHCPRVYAASGTPIPKNPAEFWTILASLFPDVCRRHHLGTYEDFLKRFCVVEGRWVRGRWDDKVLPVVRNEAEFQEILAEVMIRRGPGDDMPTLDFQLLPLDSGVKEPVLAWKDNSPVYNAVMAGALEDIAQDPHVARMRRRLGELKAPLVVQLLNSQLADSDEKVVVFARHMDVMTEIFLGLKFTVAQIRGDTSQRHRDEAIDAFQNDPLLRVLICQNEACREGITLTAARRAILVEPDWTAKWNVQMGRRIARMGQQASHCVAQLAVLAGTLDDAIVGLNLKETRMADMLGLGDYGTTYVSPNGRDV